TDSGGATYDETMTINLTNVNDTPTDLKLTNVEIAENAANGSVVGTAAVTDNAGDSATYTLTDNAGGRFAIDGATGEITVADGSLLDYESNTSHDITVRITDGGGNTYDETFTIGVNDEQEESNTYEAEVMSHGPVAYWNNSTTDQVGGVVATDTNVDTGSSTFSNITGTASDYDGSWDYTTIP
ncbi:unnamed protein product, partial [Laminaria digitata]